eukprot:jgi/Ulvmu1/2117/UM127_0002.1
MAAAAGRVAMAPSAPPSQAEPPTASPAQHTLPTITVVRTAAQLQQASVSGAMDIEIRAHIDMRSLTLAPNPQIQGEATANNPRRLALLYAPRSLRSIRGNCTESNAGAQLGLSTSVFTSLIPMRPRQCLLVVSQTWLMVNAGKLWIDNIYLKLSRHLVRPNFMFITAGALNGELTWPLIGRSDIYITRTTFQGEHRGNARGIISDITGCSIYFDDCIFTDWAGFTSPITLKFQSICNVRNTVFRNMHLAVEIADVSFGGTVRFENVLLANVTLARGAVVSTTLNDYQQAVGFYLTYYAEDDEDFDVEIQPVPPSERGVFGEEFVIVEQTMSDCLYVSAAVGTVLPACPQSSLKARNDTIDRSFHNGEDRASTGVPLEVPLADQGPGAVAQVAVYEGGDNGFAAPFSGDDSYGVEPTFDAYGGEADRSYDYLLDASGQGEPLGYGVSPMDYDADMREDYRVINNPILWYEELLIKEDDDWLAATQQDLPVIGPRPGWDPLDWNTGMAHPSRASLRPLPARIPEGMHLVPHLNWLAHSQPAPSAPADPLLPAVLCSCSVALVTVVALLSWSWTRQVLKRAVCFNCATCVSPCRNDLQAEQFVDGRIQRPVRRAAYTHDAAPRLSTKPQCMHKFSAGPQAVPQSALNPAYEYALPTRVARLMAGGKLTTRTAASAANSAMQTEKNAPLQQHVALEGPLCLQTRPLAGMEPLTTCPASQRQDLQVEFFCSACAQRTLNGTAHRTGSACRNAAGSKGPKLPSALPQVATQHPAEGNIMLTAASPTHAQSCDAMRLPLPPATVKVRGEPIVRPDSAHGHAHEVFPGSTLEQQQRHRQKSWLQRLTAPSTVDKTTEQTDSERPLTRGAMMAHLHRQLDAFGEGDLLLKRFEMPGRQQRRCGGQALVQFAEGGQDRNRYAIKFFLDDESFLTEAALYAACFPHVRAAVSDEVIARAGATAGCSSGGEGAVLMSEVVGRFLPQVVAVCDGSAGGLHDPRGWPLPPCIVMEQGESLNDWSDRAQPDLFTCLGVLSNISERVADMHDAGYVHRDLKPGNVMWLPRENRWTVIDFGCVERAGREAPLKFTLAYAAPEVVRAF